MDIEQSTIDTTTPTTATINNDDDPLFTKLTPLLTDNKLRFELELEFIELLSNPHYLQYLAQSDLLSNPDFINYLEYLQYWHQSQYIPYINHPHSLYFLELLLQPSFRQSLLDPAYINLLHTQQYWHWRSYRYNRYLEFIQKQPPQQQPQSQS